MEINKELINSFRDMVNSNSDFVYNVYKNVDNKNQWSVICSCMDWISVSVNFLSNKQELSHNIDIRVMEIFSIISSVDIIIESVTQLYRVFFCTTKGPFDGHKQIFLENQLNLSDDEYFKELRAMFGAHPVNLKHKNQTKWFASWPHDSFKSNKNIFEIRLYSNEIGVEDLCFGININEIEQYLFKYYLHLKTINDEIDKQFIRYCQSYKKITIHNVKSIVENLKTLQFESVRRFNNDYYKSCIDELLLLFSTSLNNYLLVEEQEYKKELCKVIDELFYNLQNMILADLENDKILNPDYPYQKIGYSISKLYTYDFDENKEPLFDFHMKSLDDFSGNRYAFIKSKSKNEIRLKMKMMLYRYNIIG